MAMMTMIARVVDGLPLVGTMQEDEQVQISTRELTESFSMIKLFGLVFSVWPQCVRVPEPGEIAVPEVRRSFTAALLHRNWPISIPVGQFNLDGCKCSLPVRLRIFSLSPFMTAI